MNKNEDKRHPVEQCFDLLVQIFNNDSKEYGPHYAWGALQKSVNEAAQEMMEDKDVDEALHLSRHVYYSVGSLIIAIQLIEGKDEIDWQIKLLPRDDQEERKANTGK